MKLGAFKSKDLIKITLRISAVEILIVFRSVSFIFSVLLLPPAPCLVWIIDFSLFVVPLAWGLVMYKETFLFHGISYLLMIYLLILFFQYGIYPDLH